MPGFYRRRRYTVRRSRGRRPKRAQRFTARRKLARRARRPSLYKNPIPVSRYIKFKFASAAYELTPPGTGVFIATHVFRGNSLYDPDVTGIGVQPYGYDQLTGAGGVGIFSHYCVYSSKIRIHIVPSSTSITGLKFHVIPSRNSTLSSTDPADLRQMPYCKTICWSGGDGSKKTNISNYCSSRRMYSTMTPENETFTAAYNANPYSQWYWHVILDEQTLMGTTKVYFDVEIIYYAKMLRANYLEES